VSGWDAFCSGLSRATRYRWVWFTLFAANLASGLLLAALPALGLASWLGHRPAIRQAADGVDAWLVVETLTSPLGETALGESLLSGSPRALRQGMLLSLLTLAALPALAWLPVTFLTGGALLTYAEAPQPFRWRRFLWGCWRWWGPFSLLSLVQAGVSIVLFLPLVAVAVGAVAAVGRWLAWLAVPLLGLVAALWLALVECTRAIAVLEETRNVIRALVAAARFIFRHFPALAGLYGPMLLLLILLHALYRWGLAPRLPLAWWPLVLIVQQAFILARLWARLARIAGGVALYQAKAGTQATEAPTALLTK
jgi:hypothetical protein